MSAGWQQMVCGVAVGSVLLAIIVIRRQRCAVHELAVALAGFLTALVLPIATALVMYGLAPDGPDVPTKLKGLHVYVGGSGFLLFLVSGAGIWRLTTIAFESDARAVRAANGATSPRAR